MRLKVLSTAATLMAILPGASHALGLGEIQLRSALNAPLDAEIELLDVSDEELASLRVQLASRETFTRQGLDYPGFLSGVSVRTVRGPDGRPVIRLQSAAPITEPFATLLVEANWARGRYVREYTVLLDPPVFAPAPAAQPAPVAAPVGGAGERSAPIARPAAPVEQRATAPAAAPPRAAGGDYRVRRGDTLGAIARQVAPGSLPRQRSAMIAIYRGNPAAFDGNINVLRSGSVLRLPDDAALAAVDPADALAEIRRQSQAWAARRGDAAAAPSEPAAVEPPPRPESAPAPSAAAPANRLQLVPPQSGAAAAAPTAPAATGASAEVQRRIAEIEAQLAESRRALELRSAELARLQASLADGAAVPAPSAAAPAAGELPASQAADSAAGDSSAAPPAPAVPEPVAAPAAPPAPVASEPTLLDRVRDYWYAPVGLVALLAALLGLRAYRRRREESFGDSLAELAAAGPPGFRDNSADTQPLRKLEPGSIVVEEDNQRTSATGQRPALPVVPIAEPPPAPAAAPPVPAGDSDALAEADFHMAYGLYDQAAELMRNAIRQQPGRRDLRLKLLEVYFVWGNREQFLQTARELAKTRDQAQPGEWEKVVIMGKQLAPEDPLFAQKMAGAGTAGVDLNLEGGQNRVDFDPGEPTSRVPAVDLDLGAALGEAGATGARPAITPLEFTLDEPAPAIPPAAPAQGKDPAATDATLRFSASYGAGTLETAGMLPDVTMIQKGGEELREKIEQQMRQSPDQTAELAFDDLGLDLSALEGVDSSLLDSTGAVPQLGESVTLEGDDDPTLLAGLDDTSRRLIQGGEGDTQEQPTLVPVEGADASPVAQLAALEAELDRNLDFKLIDDDHELPGDADTGTRPRLQAVEEPPASPTGRSRRPDINASQITEALPDLEPVTMSEVGTKLDLARAYMDMGDPDGARSILGEVLQEGTASQKQEAKRLLDSIPG